MGLPMYGAPLAIAAHPEEGHAIPPPDLSRRPLFFGYTTLLFSLTFIVWFAYSAWACLEERNGSFHRASPILSARWHLVLWMAVSPQLLLFCAYGSWFGWKSFQYN
ncbi:hypothetical protein LSCM1_02425 [Leishmania martiniquensis]|uniref:Uncharacterized protein n=1 Tax=Leishmania martiniquensis TaxID=1580590 RepID=A0A836H145_9TRYP|nr:hypothetical protein LSCM1_02425 [Leishmania martiniquensis]